MGHAEMGRRGLRPQHIAAKLRMMKTTILILRLIFSRVTVGYLPGNPALINKLLLYRGWPNS